MKALCVARQQCRKSPMSAPLGLGQAAAGQCAKTMRLCEHDRAPVPSVALRDRPAARVTRAPHFRRT